MHQAEIGLWPTAKLSFLQLLKRAGFHKRKLMSDTLPEKPQKTYQVFAYDYHQCRDYLQARDGYDERDYAGHWQVLEPAQVPYQDFWHFVGEQADIVNGGTFVMDDTWKEEATPWQQEILEKYLATFGEIDPTTGLRFIDFYVAW